MAEYRQGRGPFFVQIPFELQDDPRADAHTIAVYAAIKRYADFGKGTGARPSDATLAAKAGCSARQVSRQRQQLRDMGWLEWETEQGKTNRYIVHASLTPASQSEVAEPLPPSPTTPASQSEVPQTDSPTTENPDQEPDRDIPVGAAPAPLGPTWNQLACKEWIDRFGGTAPGARITKALKPLVETHGAEAVLAKWKRYLQDEQPRFANPETFATKYGTITGAATNDGASNGTHPRGPERQAPRKAAVPRPGESRYDRRLERADTDELPAP